MWVSSIGLQTVHQVAQHVVELFAEEGASPVGAITSGGFGPSLGAPVAMGYVGTEFAAPGTRLLALLRGKPAPVTVARMPFVKPTYKRA